MRRFAYIEREIFSYKRKKLEGEKKRRDNILWIYLKKICIKISLVKCKVRNENFGIIFGSNVV
jgi:hypothetical protein